MAGSTYSNSGGSIHTAIDGFYHGSYNSNTMDYDVALLKASIKFSVSLCNEICINYCSNNQLYLMLLLCKTLP